MNVVGEEEGGFLKVSSFTTCWLGRFNINHTLYIYISGTVVSFKNTFYAFMI